MDTTSTKTQSGSEHNFAFWIHVLITALAWLGPFLFSWWLMATAYGLVTLQFIIFKRCLFNSQHNLKDDQGTTFYSHVFDMLDIPHNRDKLKFFIRNIAYPALGVFSYIWQEIIDIDPLLFF